MSKRFFNLFLLLLASLFFTACPQPCDFPASDLEPTVNEFQTIVQSLEQFKKDKKKYPENLGELVPRYLEKQPVTVGGHDYLYTRHGDQFGFYVKYSQAGTVKTCEISNLQNKVKQNR